MFRETVIPHRRHSITWRCDACGQDGWPLLRIRGYPTPEAWALVDDGRAVLVGCTMDDAADTEDYECPHCEVGVDVPEAYRESDPW